MDKYFYLISQLPVLLFDKESFFNTDSFLEEAEKWMSKQDFLVLSQVSLLPSESMKIKFRLWEKVIGFEKLFQAELAAWRKARRLGQDFKPESFPLSLVKEGNPLDVEKKLLQWRWNFLDALEREHHFDLEFLVIYFLKLQILTKLSLFVKEKGMEIFKNLEETNQAKATPAEVDLSETI